MVKTQDRRGPNFSEGSDPDPQYNGGQVGSVARGLMEEVELKEWIGLHSIKTCRERERG